MCIALLLTMSIHVLIYMDNGPTSFRDCHEIQDPINQVCDLLKPKKSYGYLFLIA